jgi:hypothetical protein
MAMAENVEAIVDKHARRFDRRLGVWKPGDMIAYMVPVPHIPCHAGIVGENPANPARQSVISEVRIDVAARMRGMWR